MPGCCKNPFGGRDSLNRLDLMVDLKNSSPSQIMALRVILASVRSYLFYALGANGMDADEFYISVQYLFYVRSDKPETWGSREVTRTYVGNDGKVCSRTFLLTDKEMQSMCFDYHYDVAGLKNCWPMSKFLKELQEERKNILAANTKQVERYIADERQKEWKELGDRQIPPLKIFSWNTMQTLLKPSSGFELAELLYYSREMRAPYKGVYHIPRLRPCQRKARIKPSHIGLFTPEVAQCAST